MPQFLETLLSYTAIFLVYIEALSGTGPVERSLRASPVVSGVVNGSFQESQLIKQSNCRLSSQALRPQIGHVFVGVGSPVSLGHL